MRNRKNTRKQTAEQTQQKRQERYEQARGILEAGLEHIAGDPEALAEYLKFRAHFRSYSFRNTILIQQQMPGARYCLGFKSWLKHGRCVRKGERGLLIWKPIIRKVRTPEEAEEKGVAIGERVVFGFGTTHVFDITQTTILDGCQDTALAYQSPIPELAGDDFAHLYEDLKLVADRIGYQVEEYGRDERLANGYCNGRDVIGIRSGRPMNGHAKTLAHELAHAVAHMNRKQRAEMTEAAVELQAEGAAFLFCYLLGLDTSSYSLPYLKSYEDEHARLEAQLVAIEGIAFHLLDLLDQVRAGAEPQGQFHACAA